MDVHGLHIDDQALAAFCRRRGIRKASLFGSILRDDFGPNSDVDVLVEFYPASLPTLLDLVDMEAELSALIGRKVDLRTPEDLSEYFRNAVVRTARVQYAA
jgi:predicted nucleotidyltransferase